MTAPDRLPQRLRDCVDQTIAAEALEGWLPTTEQVDALVDLVNGEVSFDDYLAAYRSRYRFQPVRESAQRRLRREAAYLIPGTSLLRNNFGACSHETLADLEFVATAGRIAGWHRRLAHGQVGVDDVDLRAIHRQLFADVYAWAGSYRVTDLRLGGEVFAPRSSVPQMMRSVQQRARAVAAEDARTRVDELAHQLAWLYAQYNYVHPFREGNGRTGTLMLNIVSTLRGRRLDLRTVSRDEWYGASRDSMPIRRRGRSDPRSFVPLLKRALD